ncbi:YciC family protein [Methylomonas sp. AM2-LC]|uniref:YciC family protein n=1 Tax=Methylomonas sp. AM2-LC TaxID=3153301 RepID=UPI0032638538
MRFLATHPVNVGKILDSSYRLLMASYSKLLVYMFASGINEIFLNDLIEKVSASSFTALLEDPQTSVSLFVGFTGYYLFNCLCTAGMTYRINNITHQQQDSLLDSLKFSFKKLPALFFAAILYWLAVIVGVVLLVIPGIYLMFSLNFCFLFIILESASPYQSLKASHQLIKGAWWRITGIYTAPSVILIVLILLIAMVFSQFFPNDKALEDSVTNFLVAFITPYFLVLGYVQYHDQKLRKIGSDLDTRLSN